MVRITFTRKQLEKIADQTRLLSWGQGAITTSTSGLHLPLNGYVIALTIILWVLLQFLALSFDKWSEK